MVSTSIKNIIDFTNNTADDYWKKNTGDKMGFFKGYTVQLQSLAIHYWFAIVHMYRTCATDTITSNNGCQINSM